MRILEINKFFYLRRGAERHLLDVIDLLGQRGHEVEVFTMAHPENHPSRFAGYFPRYVGYNREDSTRWQRLIGVGRLFWSFEARTKMRSLLAQWQPDVVHIHNIYHQLSPSILGPIWERGIPIVMTVHDYNLVSPDKDAYYPSVGQQYYRFLWKDKYSLTKRALLALKMYWNQLFGFYTRAIAAYIVPSAFVERTLIEAGVPAEKIVVIPHFIPDETGDNLTKQPMPSDRDFPAVPFALYFGSLSREKGVAVLVEICSRLNVPLVLIGDPEPGFELPEGPVVRSLGHQPKNILKEWIARSACVVSASRLPETFGLIALEANTAGKPFFGFRTGAFPEIISGGVNGFLAEDDKALEEALKSFFDNRMSFSAENIALLARERFGANRYVESIERLFARCLKDAKKEHRG